MAAGRLEIISEVENNDDYLQIQKMPTIITKKTLKIYQNNTTEVKPKVGEVIRWSTGGMPQKKSSFKHLKVTQETHSSCSDSEQHDMKAIIREILNDPEMRDEKDLEDKIKKSIIKSYMMIFTHENSQHLLLNIDLIDIAFNCMMNCKSINIETQRNVSKLIALQLKFPQVQKKILKKH